MQKYWQVLRFLQGWKEYMQPVFNVQGKNEGVATEYAWLVSMVVCGVKESKELAG
jgi:hypothetical protein